MRVGRGAGAADVLLITSRADHDGLVHRSKAAGIEGVHVENVDALHLSENFETLETSGLLQVGRDGTRLGTGTVEIFLRLDFCIMQTMTILVSSWSFILEGVANLYIASLPAGDAAMTKHRNGGRGKFMTYGSRSCSRQQTF